MKPAPNPWPRISSSLHYEDAHGMIEWLCQALGFEVHILVEGEGGEVAHSELLYGDGLIMVGQADGEQIARFDSRRASPIGLAEPSAGANTQSLQIYVDDVDAHYQQLLKHLLPGDAGKQSRAARIVQEPQLVDYGEDYWADKSYGFVDPEGHLWWIVERVRG